MMARGSLITLLASFVIGGGCSVGEVPIGGGGPDGSSVDHEAAFATLKTGTFTARGCDATASGGTNCHGSTQTPKMTTFADFSINSKYLDKTNNILFTKGVHQNIPAYLDTAQIDMLKAFLNTL